MGVWIAIVGAAESRPRSVTVTGAPWRSTNSTGLASGSVNLLGVGAGSAPGHGASGSRSGTRSSPQDTRVMRSAGPRAPEVTGDRTASGPSNPWTLANAQLALVSSSPSYPPSPHCTSPDPIASTGSRRRKVMAPGPIISGSVTSGWTDGSGPAALILRPVVNQP